MSQHNVEIVRRGYALYAAGEVEAAAALFSPDAEVTDAGGLGVADMTVGSRTGPGGSCGRQEVLDAFEDYRIETQEFIEAGDAVIVPCGSPAGDGQAGRS